MVTVTRLLFLIVVSCVVAAQDPCDQGSEPEEPNPAEEPQPIDDSGCFDDNGQWVPGGFLVSTWCCGGELLGVECVDPGPIYKRRGHRVPPTVVDGYLALNVTLWGEDASELREEHWLTVADALILGVDMNEDGFLENRIELLQGPRREANAFVVLGGYDMPALGGNNDGWIDAADAVWKQLRFRNLFGTDTVTPDMVGIARIDSVPRADPRRNRIDYYVPAFAKNGELAFTLGGIPWNGFRSVE